MKAEDMQRLERTERMMIRWICGVKLSDRKANMELLSWLGIQCVSDAVRRGRLRWFGHVERKEPDDWVSACRLCKKQRPWQAKEDVATAR